MSTLYNDLTYTNFPDEPDDCFSYMQDVTASALPYVQQYQSLYNSGNMQGASEILIQHPEIKTMLINAEKMNNFVDAIRALERYYFSDIHKYIENIFTDRGTYASAISYQKYDLVRYYGHVYLCILKNCPIGTPPTNTYYWAELSIQGEKGLSGKDGVDGAPGIGLSFENTWISSKTYNKDSAVTYNNCLWASNNDSNKGKTPSINSDYWVKIFDLSLANDYDNSISGAKETTVQEALDHLYSQDASFNQTLVAHENKINTIETGAQKNTITGVKGSNESTYRTGNVNLTKGDLGLGNVDNTSDQNKNVNYANSAGNADTLDGIHASSFIQTSASCNRNWNWDGKLGQPTYVWGSENGLDNYVYKPSNFNVNFATNASNADMVDGFNFSCGTFDLSAGNSPLTAKAVYFQYE